MAPILQADSIGKSYRDRRILSSASVNAGSGEMIGLLGRMGEGKSTLLRIFAGQIRSDSGWIKYKGVIHERPRLSVLASDGVYFLPEEGSLASSLTLRGHFALFQRRFQLGSFRQITERFRVGQLLDAAPAAMSTGEKRRSELALVTYRKPDCVLADEPFRDLDPITAEEIGGGLRSLADDGCAIVVTGHEVRTMVPFLTSIVWLTSGTTYSLGPPSHAWENEYFRKEYLGPAA